MSVLVCNVGTRDLVCAEVSKERRGERLWASELRTLTGADVVFAFSGRIRASTIETRLWAIAEIHKSRFLPSPCGHELVKLAVKAAGAAKFRNAGQVCIAPTRFLVHSSVRSAFDRELVAYTQSLKVGDGLTQGTTMGPLANARRLAGRAVATVQATNETVARLGDSGLVAVGMGAAILGIVPVDITYPVNTIWDFGTGKTNSYPKIGPIVITEIQPNTPDAVEFMNVTTGSVSIAGWQITIYDFCLFPSPRDTATAFCAVAGGKQRFETRHGERRRAGEHDVQRRVSSRCRLPAFLRRRSCFRRDR